MLEKAVDQQLVRVLVPHSFNDMRTKSNGSFHCTCAFLHPER